MLPVLTHILSVQLYTSPESVADSVEPLRQSLSAARRLRYDSPAAATHLAVQSGPPCPFISDEPRPDPAYERAV